MLSLSENLNKSWEFFVKLFDDIGKTILLIVLEIIPIVNFIVLGYGYEIIRLGDSIEEPPALENLGDLFIKGFKVFIVIFLYFIIPIAVFFVIIGPFIIGNIFYLYASGGISLLFYSGIFWTAYFAAFIVGLGVAVIALMGVIHAIKTDNLGKAFAFSEILELIRRVGWDLYLPWVLVMYIAMYVIASIQQWIIQAILSALFVVFFSRSAHYIYPTEEAIEEAVE